MSEMKILLDRFSKWDSSEKKIYELDRAAETVQTEIQNEEFFKSKQSSTDLWQYLMILSAIRVPNEELEGAYKNIQIHKFFNLINVDKTINLQIQEAR